MKKSGNPMRKARLDLPLHFPNLTKEKIPTNYKKRQLLNLTKVKIPILYKKKKKKQLHLTKEKVPTIYKKKKQELLRHEDQSSRRKPRRCFLLKQTLLKHGVAICSSQ